MFDCISCDTMGSNSLQPGSSLIPRYFYFYMTWLPCHFLRSHMGNKIWLMKHKEYERFRLLDAPGTQRQNSIILIYIVWVTVNIKKDRTLSQGLFIVLFLWEIMTDCTKFGPICKSHKNKMCAIGNPFEFKLLQFGRFSASRKVKTVGRNIFPLRHSQSITLD